MPCMAQSQEEVYRAILQAQQLQSYGDAWAARHGTVYNPWTSYYQYREERRQRTIHNAELLRLLEALDQ